MPGDERLSRGRIGHSAISVNSLARRSARRGGRNYGPPAVAALVVTLGFAAWHGVPDPKSPVVSGEHASVPARQAPRQEFPFDPAWLLDPGPSSGAGTFTARQDAPLGSSFRLAAARPETLAEPAIQAPEHPRPLPSPPTPAAGQLAPTVPLPLPRPAGLSAPQSPRIAERPGSRQAGRAAPPAAPEDNRSFIEKLFGVQPSTGPALGYAALGNAPADLTPRPRLSPAPSAGVAPATAIYDISARVVYMPNGERLEAHSGLGESMDDPRHVSLRMRGPTPPGTYTLTEREQPFHGVRALRLHPVGGSAAIHGRAGLLAHTYLLGPSGASNGCVSFKDYDKFLQAYLRGEVRRLVVVSGSG